MYNKFLSGIAGALLMTFFFSACNSNQQTEKNNQNKGSIGNTDAFSADSFAFYENILINDSLNTELRTALASNYYADKNFKKAINHLLIVCQIDDKNIESFILLGNIYYDVEQNENAIEYYEKALALDDKNVDVRCDLATCYLNIEKPEQACALLKQNIAIDNNHAQSHHNLSVVYTQLGKAKEAEDEMKIYNNLVK